MRLATRSNGSRDGELLIVSSNGERCAPVGELAPNLQFALDRWSSLGPSLLERAEALERGACGAPLELEALLAPLPRAYEWLDGSAFIHHIELVRKARGAELPESLLHEPLMYQGGSGHFLAPRAPVPLADVALGLDFEAEVAVVVDDTPEGTSAETAFGHIRLIMLANDWTLRNLVPSELAKGFGFLVSKPATAFSPWAATPDELGASFRDGRLHLALESYVNDELIGSPNAGPEMHFSFCDLIAHATRTRTLTAGTIIGSGTVSNRDPARGVSCLAERRTLETLEHGAPRSDFLKPGDRVRIEMWDASRRNLFGSIEQQVVSA